MGRSITGKPFTSPGGHSFTFRRSERSDVWGHIYYDGLPAGQVFNGATYPGKPFSASTRALYWRMAGDAPVGVGFDVAAFETLDECLTAWGRSADEILDWHEGKPVTTLYGTVMRNRWGA